MRLIFLDIDGVLNDHYLDSETKCGRILPEKVALLNGILRETGALIVLSSAWRYIVHRGEANLQGMDWLLRSHGVLAGRLAGITRQDTMRAVKARFNGDLLTWPVDNERGLQIADYLADWPLVERYVVIDDLDLGISAAGHPFVHVDGKVGMTDSDARLAIWALCGAQEPRTGDAGESEGE